MTKQLYTTQGENLPQDPWQVYPRPQMKRESYVNLNGQWDFAVTETDQCPQEFSKQIIVPFCPESVLSGIGEHFPEGSYLWYRRQITFPQDFVQDRVLLHVGAADQYLECYVNRKKVGSHSGGYTAMTFDITDYLQQTNEILLCCRDDLRQKHYPYGKQTMDRGGMWYTPVSGIWQTVWLESVRQGYIQSMHIENRGASVRITTVPACDGMIRVGELGGFSLVDGVAVITPENPRLWSPEDPYLYNFTLETDKDFVESYFALRILQIQVVDGVSRLCLNGKPYFFHGLLDQGYWPDGIYTPAVPECYAEDIQAMKNLGFNTLRKHIKVEPAEFYYQCDKLGMLVFQDMVNNGDYGFFRDTALPTVGVQKLNDKNLHKNPKTRKFFLQNMEQTVQQLKNYPCIVYWTIFNEGWGQFDSDAVYAKFKMLDDTRFVDSTSGWFRRKCSDVESLHIYFGPWSRLKTPEKPLVLSEFGGHTYRVEGHVFNPDKAYGYKTCETLQAYQDSVEQLYRTRIIPAVKKGLCGAIYTQVSDVEDEINGLLTYDRKVCKVDARIMQAIADALMAEISVPEIDRH